eukprot:scaffold1368_cov20-Tisochrysis_lutea.AAC.1
MAHVPVGGVLHKPEGAWYHVPEGCVHQLGEVQHIRELTNSLQPIYWPVLGRPQPQNFHVAPS